jgi:hypothetical protein
LASCPENNMSTKPMLLKDIKTLKAMLIHCICGEETATLMAKRGQFMVLL